MSHRVASGLERGNHQFLKNCRRQQSPALGQRPIGATLAGELFDMLSQGASLGHDMKDQALN